MKIELFLDEDVHSGLAHALRKRGYDAIHAQELDRKGRSDSDQLLFAIHQERCLFTFNVKDFVILHNQHAKSQQGTLGDHCFKTTPIQRNDVKIVTPASAYCQRNNEEPFGVFVNSIIHSIYLRSKSKTATE